MSVRRLVGVARQEDYAHAIFARLWQARNLGAEKLMRKLKHYPRAVAGYLVASCRAAMMEVEQDLLAVFDY